MVARWESRKINFGDRLDESAVNDCGCARWKLWGYWRSTDRSLAACRGSWSGALAAALALAEHRTRTASSTKSSVNTSRLSLQHCDYRILLSKFLLGSHWTRSRIIADCSTTLRDHNYSPQLPCPESFTSRVYSLDHLGHLHLCCKEAPLLPWSGPLESRRSSNGSSYSRHGHCAGQS